MPATWPLACIGKAWFCEVKKVKFCLTKEMVFIQLIIIHIMHMYGQTSLITEFGVKGALSRYFNGNFVESKRVSSYQLNSKIYDLVLLLKTIWRYWNCFLSPVAMDDMDRNGLKLKKKNWPIFF